MISAAEASQLISQHLPSWGLTPASPPSSASLITAEDLIADREYPPFNRATMDGIALSWEAFEAGQREFPLRGVVAAGEPETALTDPQGAVEIMTGAPVPRNADLVIQYEHLEIVGGVARITNSGSRARFDCVHRQGSDCHAGDVMLEKGMRLNGPRWGIAASFGYESVRSHRQPRIKIISTGNELVNAGTIPLPHQIRRSNALALLSSLRMHGFEEVLSDHLPDDPKAIRKHFEESTKEFDLLIYSGAVSKGKFDHLPNVWAEAGVKKIFHGVSQRPGKPLWFGVHERERTAVVGLPGNPISSLVCLHRYLLPRREIYAELSQDFDFSLPLTYFLPVTTKFEKSGKLLAFPASFRNSGEFTSLAATDGFLELPQGSGPFRAGQGFAYYPWRGI